MVYIKSPKASYSDERGFGEVAGLWDFIAGLLLKVGGWAEEAGHWAGGMEAFMF